MTTKQIAKVKSTQLGFEDHGIMTAWLHLDYGGTGQGAGGFALGGSVSRECNVPYLGEFVRRVLLAFGVDDWENLPGRTIYAISDKEGLGGSVIGFEPLPTERGEKFLFAEAGLGVPE